MSEASSRTRVVKQRWAEPGSAHDRLVRWTKIVLPSAVGVLIAILALAPLDKRGDVSFILDKKKVQSAPERMRVEAARYTGTDDKGQLFEIIANRAIQRSSDDPLVDIDLRRSQADTRSVIHGIGHIGDQFLQAGVKYGNRLGNFVQARIGIAQNI